MMAQVCDMEPGTFVHTFGDVHLYNNHREQALLQLSRSPFPLPVMKLNPEVKDLFRIQIRRFHIGELPKSSRYQSARCGIIFPN